MMPQLHKDVKKALIFVAVARVFIGAMVTLYTTYTNRQSVRTKSNMMSQEEIKRTCEHDHLRQSEIVGNMHHYFCERCGRSIIVPIPPYESK